MKQTKSSPTAAAVAAAVAASASVAAFGHLNGFFVARFRATRANSCGKKMG